MQEEKVNKIKSPINSSTIVFFCFLFILNNMRKINKKARIQACYSLNQRIKLKAQTSK